MAECRRASSLPLTVAALLGACAPVLARVQDYQIVRLLAFKSECRLDSLVERSESTGPLRFHATCENVSFYPDGVEVICDDRDDDRSCRVATPAKSFDSLDLLRR